MARTKWAPCPARSTFGDQAAAHSPDPSKCLPDHASCCSSTQDRPDIARILHGVEQNRILFAVDRNKSPAASGRPASRPLGVSTSPMPRISAVSQNRHIPSGNDNPPLHRRPAPIRKRPAFPASRTIGLFVGRDQMHAIEQGFARFCAVRDPDSAKPLELP
jgi:hypothetical protein